MKVTFCLTDEAPLLAMHSFHPIARAFLGACGIDDEVVDVSLGRRVLRASVPESPATHDILAYLVADPSAHIVKPPGISASLAQLKAAIVELQRQGHRVPDYPEAGGDPALRLRYEAIRGSVVNAALRQGNSERRIPAFVKAHARRQMAPVIKWPRNGCSRVATMSEGDFRATEQAVTARAAGPLRIEHVGDDGQTLCLAEAVAVAEGDVVSAGVMRRASLAAFLDREIEACRKDGLLFSLQLKCTTMRVADPIIFAHAVRARYARLIEHHGRDLDALGIDAGGGLSVLRRAASLVRDPAGFERLLMLAELEGPALAMRDAAVGVSTLDAPGGPSIATSMASAMRTGWRAPDAEGIARDTCFVIPDHSYAGIYDAVLQDFQTQGPPDPASIGSVVIVGLTADAADEYGAQDTTFEIARKGELRVVDAEGEVLIRHGVSCGDIWRLCRASKNALQDWMKRGLETARRDEVAATFLLDPGRPRDREVLRELHQLYASAEATAVPLEVLAPTEAIRCTLERLRRGESVVAVTGNLLRDYLTELFAVLEVGTSSSVQATTYLVSGGAMFETGSGGCAPAHVQQFVQTRHLRWNPLGDAVALATALEHLSRRTKDSACQALAQALVRACDALLSEELLPSRQVGQLDTCGSHFHLCRLWALEAAKTEVLVGLFADLASQLDDQRTQIERELLAVQGGAIDLGGYYLPDHKRLAVVMRPSPTFNSTLALHNARFVSPTHT